ncbi:MAG TPA: RluA family pseudouridine synthase [Burkholderiaceae bacterium]|nr:RluA family pseudouridine synthase [Burkholderiaceae bacterium]
MTPTSNDTHATEIADDDWNELATSTAIEPIEALVPLNAAGARIDKVAAELFGDYSRAKLQQWIAQGRITVDGVVATAKTRLLGNERMRLAPLPAPETIAFLPEPIPLNVVHEDGACIVIDKQAGLVVHPAAGNWTGTLLNGLLHRYPELAQVPRAGIVHRLDKDTTGLMVVARTIEAQTALVRQLQARTVHREYIAMCWGRAKATTINAPIGRHPRDRLRMAVVDNGKPAITHVEVVGEGRLAERDVTALRCRLETGRTHQIRVHLASIGHSLVGDVLYASRAVATANATTFPRQALHAARLEFMHPRTQTPVSCVSPIHDDLRSLFALAQLPVQSLVE